MVTQNPTDFLRRWCAVIWNIRRAEKRIVNLITRLTAIFHKTACQSKF